MPPSIGQSYYFTGHQTNLGIIHISLFCYVSLKLAHYVVIGLNLYGIINGPR